MFFTKYVEVSECDFDPNVLEEKSWLIVVSLLSEKLGKAFDVPFSVKIAGGEKESELWFISKDLDTTNYIAAFVSSVENKYSLKEPFLFALELGGKAPEKRKLHFEGIRVDEAFSDGDFQVEVSKAIDNIREKKIRN